MTYLLATLLLSGLLATPAATPPAGPIIATSAPDDDPAYAAGTKAMNESRWSDAVTSFDQVINARGKRSDAALYWKAYSLDKLGKQGLAIGTCEKLQALYSRSDWIKDCEALKLQSLATLTQQAQQKGGDSADMARFFGPDALQFKAMPLMRDYSAHSKDPDADLKILALNSLLNREPSQAIPVLKGVLTGNQPEAVKQQALFVLSQSHSTEAAALMADLITGKQGPLLQKQAIQDSGMFQGKRQNDALVEVYRTTSDMQIKHAVISAFFISQDADRLVQLARAEKNVDLKRTIVSQLALMPGKASTDYMMELLK